MVVEWNGNQWSNCFNLFSNGIRKLYCNCHYKWLSFFTLFSDSGYGKSSSSNTNNYGGKCNNILCWQFSNVNIQFSNRKSMVVEWSANRWSNSFNIFSNSIRKLYSNCNIKWLSFVTITSDFSYSKSKSSDYCWNGNESIVLRHSNRFYSSKLNGYRCSVMDRNSFRFFSFGYFTLYNYRINSRNV